VLLTAAQTLTNKTLTTPTISNFTSATHDHEDAAGGGQLSLTTAVSGILPSANGGTGVNNGGRTLTVNTNSGTLAFGAASKTLTINESLNLSGASGQTLTLTNSLTVQGGGNTVLSSSGNFTLTIPKTGTVPVGTGTAGRIAEWVTDANTVQASTLAKTGAGVLTLSASGNFTLTIPATGTAALLATANVFTAAQTVNGDLTVDTDVLVVDSTNNRVGIGTAAPAQRLHIVGTGDLSLRAENASYKLDFGVDATSSFFQSRTAANAAAALYLYTGATVRLVIGATGNVGIGETSPTAQLQVEQTNAFGAKPTLRLQQLDLTREFIRFDTTVGAGNPVNTTALGSYYGRVRVWVEGVGAKWLALYD
jgi:hypothetical protein